MKWLTAIGSVFACCMGFWGCNSILGIDAATRAQDSGVAVHEAAANDAGGDEVSAADDASADSAVTSSYVVSCTNYCTLIQAACTGDNLEYLSTDVCMKFCENFEPTSEVLIPESEPTSADTLNCRVWHANAALIGSPHTHCPHAGPLGGSVCNDNTAKDPACEPFCVQDLAICTGANAVYETRSDCLDACRGQPDGGGGYFYDDVPDDDASNDIESQTITGSDTLNCRLYHLENAVISGLPDLHCPHTSPSGGGKCPPPGDP